MNDAEAANDFQEEILSLRAEVERLQAQLAQLRGKQKRNEQS
jgi:ubiquinone biosynthesis protein UbiJ